MHLNYLIELDKKRGEKDNLSAVAIVPYKESAGSETNAFEKNVQNKSRDGADLDDTGDTDPVNAVIDDVLHIRIDPDPEYDDTYPAEQNVNMTDRQENDSTEPVNLYVPQGASAPGTKTDNGNLKTIAGRFYIMVDEKEVRETADGKAGLDI